MGAISCGCNSNSYVQIESHMCTTISIGAKLFDIYSFTFLHAYVFLVIKLYGNNQVCVECKNCYLQNGL